jgi:quercetin dioxygenase-like cupin family protein
MYSKHLVRIAFVMISCLFFIHTGIGQETEKAFIWNADDENLEWLPCPEFMPEGCQLAVLQGNPEDRNADIFFKLPGGTTAPHHWHTSAERMVLISGELHVDYDGQEPIVMKPGTYAYGPAELPHVASCVSDDPCILFIAFEEPVDAIPVEGCCGDSESTEERP